DRLLEAYAGICMTEDPQEGLDEPVDWEEVLSSASNYVDFLKRRFGEEDTDEEIESRAHEYVIDPAGLKQLVTGHIRWFWKNHLEREWQRVRPMLEESARAFNQVDYSNMSNLEIIEFVTGKDVDSESKWESKWGKAVQNAEK